MAAKSLHWALLFGVSLTLSACSAGMAPLGVAFDSPAMEPAKPSTERSKTEELSMTAALDGFWDKVTSPFASEAPAVAPRPGPARLARFDPAAAQKLVNDYRKAKGLRPLAMNARLSAAARAHSEDLARKDRISHYGSDGSDPWARVTRTGYPARLAAENVGAGQLSIEEVFEGWRKSPDHDANLLLADAREMGVALIHRPETEFQTFWTLIIAAPDRPTAAR